MNLGSLAGLINNRFYGRFSDWKHIMNLLVLGTVLRLALSLFTSHPNDEEVWYIAAVNMLSGQGTPYGTWYFSYPPVWAYLFFPFISVLALISNPYVTYVRLSLNSLVVPVMAPAFNVAVKLPIIIADILVGLTIFEFVKTSKGVQIAKEAFIFWFFNPLVIFSGAILAQFDVFPALLSLLAFVFFIKNEHIMSGMSLSIGAMTKVYPVFLMPSYLAFIIKPSKEHATEWKRRIFQLSLFIAGTLLAIGFLMIPIMMSNSFRTFFEGILRRSNYVTSIGGLTPLDLLWLFVDANVWSNEFGRAQSIYLILSVLQIAGIAIILYNVVFRQSKQPYVKRALEGQICLLVLLYVTSTTVNPQYIIWIMPFLILGYGLYGDYRLRTAVLSAAGCFLAFYWAYPLYPITVFFNRSIGIALSDVLNLSLNPSVFFFGIFFGLLGAGAILLLPFPGLSVAGVKARLSRALHII